MKKHLKYTNLVLVALIIGSCYSSEYYRLMSEALKQQKKHPEQKVFDGEVEPAMPDKVENDKTILGIDTNKNGIRDDVDIWINRTGLDYNERMAMRQYARAIQGKLMICEGRDREKMNLQEIGQVQVEMTTYARDFIDSSSCLRATSDYRHKENHVASKIDILIKNIGDRDQCHKLFNQFSYIAQGSYMDPHKNCRFSIENESEVIKSYRKFWRYSQ